MLDIWTAFDGTDSAMYAVIYIVLSIFTDLKLERIIAFYRSTLFADLNLEITQITQQPECSTWHKFPNPGGAISTKNVIFPIQGAQFWLKMSYFQPRGSGFWSNMSYLQPRGHNFNQKCHIANTCGMFLAKFIIKFILNT